VQVGKSARALVQSGFLRAGTARGPGGGFYANDSICLTGPVLARMGLDMKTIALPLALLLSFLLRGWGAAPGPAAAPASELILRWHFTGLTTLLADTNAAKLKQIWSLPSTAEVRKQAFEQLARVPFALLSKQLPQGAPDQATLFRALLDDLTPRESFLEWRGAAGRPAEALLAVQVGDERSRLWRENLRQALEKWRLGSFADANANGAQGWRWTRFDGQTSLACVRAGQWVVVGLGPAGLPLHAQTLQRIQAEGRPGPAPTSHWLVADLNLERLQRWLPPLAPYAHPPLAHLVVSNKADNVLTRVELTFPQGHGWKSEPWTIPTSLVHSPLISFTAVQGLGQWLQPWKSFQQLAFGVAPSQLIIWANSSHPFLTQMAVPVKNAEQELKRLAPVVQGMVSTNKYLAGQASIGWDSATRALIWRGLPLAQPRLEAERTAEGEFLLGGLFPRPAGTDPAPPELFRQVRGRSDLVYYDWEITESRLRQWHVLYQLLDMTTGRAFVSTNAPSQRWLRALAPLLGETVTQVTATSPTQFVLLRKSHGGLTAFELTSCTRWLDSPGFPELSVLGPAKSLRPTKKEPPKKR
jgi:hypothetical protein